MLGITKSQAEKLQKLLDKEKKSVSVYFGIADYEFVVIYEIPNIFEWVAVTEELRSAEARKWITNEAPILTGIRMDV